MDYRLVEYCFRLPGRLKYQNGLARKYCVVRWKASFPANKRIVRNRDKLGYNTLTQPGFREYPEKKILYPILGNLRNVETAGYLINGGWIASSNSTWMEPITMPI